MKVPNEHIEYSNPLMTRRNFCFSLFIILALADFKSEALQSLGKGIRLYMTHCTTGPHYHAKRKGLLSKFLRARPTSGPWSPRAISLQWELDNPFSLQVRQPPRDALVRAMPAHPSPLSCSGNSEVIAATMWRNITISPGCSSSFPEQLNQGTHAFDWTHVANFTGC